MKRFLHSPAGLGLAVLVALCLLTLGIAASRVYGATHPERRVEAAIDFEAMELRVTDVELNSLDDVPLSAWWIAGDAARPTIVLCHDVGSGKGALLNLGLALRDQGFNLLLFDFRGHGSSGPAPTTLGLAEKRDVVGALDYLTREQGIPVSQIGVYGVGMGAHAAVLAADERHGLKVLVLDGLFPDASFALRRRMALGWEAGERAQAILARPLFSLMNGHAIETPRASDVVGRLVGRDLLLLAPADDEELALAMREMYETIPEQADADGNLMVLDATQGTGLYGEGVAEYHGHVGAFFSNRLRAKRRTLNVVSR
ncbi:MAG: alpha/beta hydrolase [bacterium]|nr:alpha/beta hydrolase [bacterium]